MADLREDWETPAVTRLSERSKGFTEIMAAHDAAVIKGDDTYLDPATGYVAFTAPALAARPCCDASCRHCPWDRSGPS